MDIESCSTAGEQSNNACTFLEVLDFLHCPLNTSESALGWPFDECSDICRCVDWIKVIQMWNSYHDWLHLPGQWPRQRCSYSFPLGIDTVTVFPKDFWGRFGQKAQQREVSQVWSLAQPTRCHPSKLMTMKSHEGKPFEARSLKFVVDLRRGCHAIRLEKKL